MLVAHEPVRSLGGDPARAPLRFGEEPKAPGAFAGRRVLWLGDAPAYDLTYWCGTCPITFERLPGANETLSIPELEARLRVGLDGIDPEVLSAVGRMLPADRYLPMLTQIRPRLVRPVEEGDYFAGEQVGTWGIDAFWGLPENPRTPYYRTFETAVNTESHLYEFVVPMVPPSWNDRSRVETYERELASSSTPTAVAVSLLDISQPAVADESRDYYEHWGLVHFLIDGHHKLEAAASSGRSLRLLALIAVGASLAGPEDVVRLAAIRAQPAGARPVR